MSTTPNTPAVPAWIEPPARQRRRMTVVVSSDVRERFEYEGIFGSSFDAYDDALLRFPFASRVEVKPVRPATATTAGAHTGDAR